MRSADRILRGAYAACHGLQVQGMGCKQSLQIQPKLGLFWEAHPLRSAAKRAIVGMIFIEAINRRTLKSRKTKVQVSPSAHYRHVNRWRTPVVTERGPYAAVKLLAYRIDPRTGTPSLYPKLANLQPIPHSLEIRKGAMISERQTYLAKKLQAAGLLSDMDRERVFSRQTPGFAAAE